MAAVLFIKALFVCYIISFAELPSCVNGLVIDKCIAPTNFPCANGKCITKLKHCDGVDDCGDLSDEQNCGGRNCTGSSYWRCHDGLCISSLYRCDDSIDCPDGSDEVHCHADYRQDKLLYRHCQDDEFTCTDGDCIEKKYHCDGTPDCFDDSDEKNCTVKCEGFKCHNGDCITSIWRCDNHDDCGDNSDEQNCEKRAVDDHCSIDDGYFPCKDNTVCLSAGDVCNSMIDCKDGSDEGVLCYDVTKNCASKNCSHACLNTPEGAICICPTGYTLKDHRTCLDVDECTLLHAKCSHTCINLPGSFKCQCDQGYELIANNRTCKAIGGDAILVFSTKNEVRALNINTKEYHTVAKNVKQAVGIAYDGNYVYWTEIYVGSEAIIRASLNGSNKQVIVKNGLGTPEDIAIDWFTGNIYFTDMEYQHIAVCSNDGLHCSIIISKFIDKPRALALHPQQGHMYWTDWGKEPEIGRANMDGSEDMSLVHKDLVWPNGLTIDYPGKRLYWVDGHSAKLESINLDGTDRKVVLDTIHHPYWLSIFEDNIYWSDWFLKAIDVCNKNTGKERKTLVRVEEIFGIHIYHPSMALKKRHACQHNLCSHLCLLKGNNSFSCACPEGKVLADDKANCLDMQEKQMVIIGAGNQLLLVEHQSLGRHDISKIQVDVQSIDSLVYDNLLNRIIIYDSASKSIHALSGIIGPSEGTRFIKTETLVAGSLESIESMHFDSTTDTLYLCDSYRGTIEVMSMGTRQRAVIVKEINGDAAIDLALVYKYGYMFVAFRTIVGEIYIAKMSMDGQGTKKIIIEHGYEGPIVKLHYEPAYERIYVADYGSGKVETFSIDGTGRQGFKEINLPVSLTILNRDLFWTSEMSKRLYWTNTMTDGPIKKIKIDVPPVVQMHVTALKLKPTVLNHPCASITSTPICSHLCVQKEALVVGERGSLHSCLCPTNMRMSHDGKTCERLVECLSNQFKCAQDNLCIPLNKVCNGVKDCTNGDDELQCAEPIMDCKNDEFECGNKRCISKNLRCNSHNDCSDNSDEENCQNYDPQKRCVGNEFECRSGICIPRIMVCDGKPQCSYGEDELSCSANVCKSFHFQCRSGKCIPVNWECDGEIDCDDGSDEHNKCAYNKPCASGKFRCRSGKCIDAKLICNVFDDCGDGSDESGCPTFEEKHKELKECKDDEYSCETDESICLPFSAKCNGTKECPHGEDELKCFNKMTSEECKAIGGRKCVLGGKCIPPPQLCNGIPDCPDGSDEDAYYCKDLKKDGIQRIWDEKTHVNLRPVHCTDGYLCKNGQCIDYSDVCNKIRNCYDGSDEDGSCDSSCTRSICEDECVATPNGGICSCRNGRRLASNGRSCEPLPSMCLGFPRPCDQYCRDVDSTSYICSCFDGYLLRADRRSCKAVGEPLSIIYMANDEIRRMSPRRDVSPKVILKVTTPKMSGIDIISSKKSVFYSIEALGQIHHLDYLSNQENIVSKLGKPTLLAVDWLTENIYFVDNNETVRIAVCHIDKRKCAHLQETNSEAVITAFTVDPINKFMFYAVTTWSLFNKSKSIIYRADLDGTGIIELVNTELSLCSGLAADYERKIVYFSDQVGNTISGVKYNGTQKLHNVIKNKKVIVKPYHLDFFEDKLYFTTDGTQRMTKCNIYGDSNCAVFSLHMFGTQGFKIDQPSKQKNASNVCAHANCTHLCVGVPFAYRCLCSDGSSVADGVSCDSNVNVGMFTEGHGVQTPGSRQMKSVIAVSVLFSVLFAVLGLLAYYRYKWKKTTNPQDPAYSVHFQNPGFGRLSLLQSAAEKMPSILRPNQREYENPLNKKPSWPMNMTDSNIKQMTQKIAGKQLNVPGLLVDTDSDVESDRDLHDGDHKEKTKLIP